ncbi:MAG: YceD family protein [Aquificaceae bacterium]
MRSVNLKKAFEKSKTLNVNLKLRHDELDLPKDIMDAGEEFTVRISISKKGPFYQATILLKGKVLLECSRCLKIFAKELNLKETLDLKPYPKTYRENLSSEDLCVSFIEDEENFDLLNLVREQIILSIPNRRICSIECCETPLPTEGFSLKQLLEFYEKTD